MGDHTETLQLDFDPTVVSYAELFDLFWKTHNPCARQWSRQYMSAVFWHDEAQKELIAKSIEREQAERGREITTAILPATEFWRAEDYHQKYSMRRWGNLMREFKAMYPEDRGFVDSTAAARINGYLGGHGTRARLEQELDGFGLSEEGKKAMHEAVRR
jgi:hypothetical protein